MRTVEDACPYGILPNIYNTDVSDSHKYSIYVVTGENSAIKSLLLGKKVARMRRMRGIYR